MLKGAGGSVYAGVRIKEIRYGKGPHTWRSLSFANKQRRKGLRFGGGSANMKWD